MRCYNSSDMNSSANATQEYFKWGISENERIINFAFLSIVAAVTVCGNIIALHAFIVTPELKRNTYYFIANLCVSDLMVACLSIPMWLWMVANNFQQPTPPWVVVFHSCLDIYCGTLSIMSLAMIGVERFICIKHALRYHQILTTRRVSVIIGLLMVYAGICTSINYLANNVYRTVSEIYTFLQCVILLMAFVVPVSMKIFSYGNIYQEAKRQIAEINKHQSIGLIESYDDDVGDNGSNFVDINDNDSAIIRMEHSASRNSRVSWTASPLARRRKENEDGTDKQRDSIATGRGCSPNSEDLSSQESLDSSKTTFKKSIRAFFRVKSCCRGDAYHQKHHRCQFFDSNENLDKSLPIPLHQQSCTMNRQNTNTSIKSILKKKSSDEDESSYLMEVTFDAKKDKPIPPGNQEQCLSSGNGGKPTTLTTKKKLRKAASVQETQKNILLIAQKSTNSEQSKDVSNNSCDTQERIRALSCPANKSARQSLEVSSSSSNGIGLFQKQRQDHKEQEPRKGSSSPFLRRFRGESNSPSLNSKRLNKQRRHEQKVRRFKKEIRAAKVVGFIMGTFLVCWTPFMVFIVLAITGFNGFDMRSLSVAVSLHYLNSAINPILYVMLNKVYRKAVVKAFKRLKRYFHRV